VEPVEELVTLVDEAARTERVPAASVTRLVELLDAHRTPVTPTLRAFYQLERAHQSRHRLASYCARCMDLMQVIGACESFVLQRLPLAR
jgi:hypothetical protein